MLVVKFSRGIEVCACEAGCVVAFHLLNVLEGLDHVWRWCRRSCIVFCPFLPSFFLLTLNFVSVAGLYCGSFENGQRVQCMIQDARFLVELQQRCLPANRSHSAPRRSDTVHVHLHAFCQVTWRTAECVSCRIWTAIVTDSLATYFVSQFWIPAYQYLLRTFSEFFSARL